MGISKYAASALGDIVHIDLPSPGTKFGPGETVVSSKLLSNFNLG
jgi:glycine cleavage system H lipoate-binding protein